MTWAHGSRRARRGSPIDPMPVLHSRPRSSLSRTLTPSPPGVVLAVAGALDPKTLAQQDPSGLFSHDTDEWTRETEEIDVRGTFGRGLARNVYDDDET
eukprot:6493067-Prymnesium_polylepis.1